MIDDNMFTRIMIGLPFKMKLENWLGLYVKNA